MSTTYSSHAPWRVAIPPLMVNAGTGGAMLTIRLLHPTLLELHDGQAMVIHDPVGLTGERVLAHVYRAAAEQQVEGHHPSAQGATLTHALPVALPVAPPSLAKVGYSNTLRWVVARAPLSAVWAAAESQPERGWRSGRRAPPYRQVAESATPNGSGVLLLSESDRLDALSPQAAARTVLRAVRRGWSILAVTREAPGSLSASDDQRQAGAWRTHLLCQSGVLVPFATHR